jgi:pilus assembly protein CpaC
VLGDLPFVGVGFSRVDYTTRESELVILVTPRLVHPMDGCQTPKRLPGQETRTPDDYELFLENILEAPRGQRKVWNGRCYNAAYKCDPTVAKYPCAGNVCTGPNGTCLPAPGPVGSVIVPGYAAPAPVVPGPVIPHSGGLGAGAVPMPMPEAPSALPMIPGTPAGRSPEAAPVVLPPLPPSGAGASPTPRY